MNKYLVLLVVLLAAPVFATEPSRTGKVTKMMTYTEYGGGDVVFSLEVNGSICSSGYYLSKNDPGFEAAVAMLLSAYHAKTPVRVYGHTELDRKWAGSSGHYCHVYNIGYGY